MVRAYSEKGAKYPGGHRIIRNASTSQVGDRAKQSGDQRYADTINETFCLMTKGEYD